MTAPPAILPVVATVGSVDPRPDTTAGDAPRPGSALRMTVLSVFGQGVVSGTSFLTAVAVGRTCGREEFGNYALALSIVLFLRAVQGDLIAAPYTVYCGRRYGPTLATYTGSTMVHQMVLSALAAVVLLVLAGAIALGEGPKGLAITLWTVLSVVPFLLLRDHLRQYAIAHLELGTALMMDGAAAVFQLGGLAVLVSLGALTVVSAYAVMGVTCTFICVVWYVAARRPMRFERALIAADWRENWAFSRWALLSQIVGRATGYLTPWVLAAAHGEAATGVLAACVTLSNLAGTFISGVSAYLTPRAAHAYAAGGRAALRRVLQETALLYLTTVGAFCLVVLVAGDPLVSFVYGSRYVGTGSVLSVLAFGMLANSLGITAGNGLWALDRPRANFAADVGTLLASLASLLILVGPLGVMGAAVAMLAGSAVGAVIRAVTLLRLMGPEGTGGDR